MVESRSSGSSHETPSTPTKLHTRPQNSTHAHETPHTPTKLRARRAALSWKSVLGNLHAGTTAPCPKGTLPSGAGARPPLRGAPFGSRAALPQKNGATPTQPARHAGGPLPCVPTRSRAFPRAMRRRRALRPKGALPKGAGATLSKHPREDLCRAHRS